MKKIPTIALLATLPVPAGVLLADTPLASPESLTKISCDDIHYSAAFLERYPKAPAACLEGRIANGEKWAKFNAKVYLVSLPDFITVEMLDVSGYTTSTFSFKPKPNSQIVINGKSTPFTDVKPGDVITLWMPEQRLEARALPTATAEGWNVLPPQKVRTAEK